MLRSLAIVAALAGAAHADPAPCAPSPVDRTLRPLVVQADGTAGGVLVPAPGSVFPAVSDDGTTVVDLFQDSTDFVGEPVSTLATFTRRGPGASVQLTGDLGGGTAPPQPENVQLATRAVMEANAILAKHRWRALAEGAVCPAPADVEQAQPLSRVALADGLRIAFDPASDQLTIDGRVIPHHFPAPGDSEFGGCGAIRAIERAYGSRKLGFVVLEPGVNLGGDSCTGKLGVETTIVVPIP